MITIEKFRREHLENFKVQSGQDYFDDVMQDEEYIDQLEGYAHSYTLLIDGWVFFIYGWAEHTEDRALLWGIVQDFSTAPKGIEKKGAGAFRRIKHEIEQLPYSRIEAHAHQYHTQGHKLLNMLGFINETPNGMRNFYGKQKGYLYARTKI